VRLADTPSLLRLGLAGVLGVGAALLVACGSSSSALIPAGSAGPLQNDFNAVASDVKAGDCTDAKSEVAQARADLAALPVSVNAQLLQTLTSGVQTLAARASTECRLNTPTDTSTTATTTTQTQTGATNTSTDTTPTDTNTGTGTGTTPTETDTTPTGTDTGTTPTDTNTSPATTPSTTTPVVGGGAQAPGTPTPPDDPSGGTPGGGN
jgi:hypothetical protein